MRADMLRGLVIFDLEATCWESRSEHNRSEMEIIEIGAVRTYPAAEEILSAFQTFVRPIRNPVLSEFCTKLTTITQARVDSSPVFSEALATFIPWIGNRGKVIPASWGYYDRNQLTQDCSLHGLPYPFENDHLNLKPEFSRLRKVRPKGIKTALRTIGLDLEGTHHRALDDARNIFRIYRWMVKNGYRFCPQK